MNQVRSEDSLSESQRSLLTSMAWYSRYLSRNPIGTRIIHAGSFEPARYPPAATAVSTTNGVQYAIGQAPEGMSARSRLALAPYANMSPRVAAAMTTAAAQRM